MIVFFKKKEKPLEEKPVADKIKILIVDDDQFFRSYYQDIFIKLGYEVILAANGQEALDSVLHIQPDIIILDIVMPGMDGKEVLERLRINKATEKTPIIMLTSEASVKNMDETRLSSTAFLNKNTITPNEITLTVQQELSMKRTRSNLSIT